MWRVCNQYMTTWNEPADFLEEPVSPITGTKFENATAHKMVHISEFTADLIKHNKLEIRYQPQCPHQTHLPRFLQYRSGMGIFEEPRDIINNVLPEGHFFEMPPNTIREKTFCCGASAGLERG